MSSLNDARFNYFVGSASHILAEDRMFVGDMFEPNLPNGSTLSLGFTTGDKITGIGSFTLSDRSDQTEVEIYEGGAYSGGTAIEFFNMNRALNIINPPFVSSFQGVTIDTPGLRIRRLTILGSTNKKNVTSANQGVGMLLAANTVYYFNITNNDATDNADYDLQMTVASGD